MKYLLIILTLLLSSCIDIQQKSQKSHGNPVSNQGHVIVTNKYQGSTVYLVEIDSCEYLRNFSGGITHKGNCKYCKIRNQK